MLGPRRTDVAHSIDFHRNKPISALAVCDDGTCFLSIPEVKIFRLCLAWGPGTSCLSEEECLLACSGDDFISIFRWVWVTHGSGYGVDFCSG